MTFDINDEIDVVNHPGPDCPSWCVMGVNGECAGNLEQPPASAPETPGWHVYTRKRLQPDGTTAVEIAIYEDGGVCEVCDEGSPEHLNDDHGEGPGRIIRWLVPVAHAPQ